MIAELNKHLFAQLDRLNKELSDDELKLEVERSQAVTGIAKQVIDAGALVVSAEKVRQEYGTGFKDKKLLEGIQ